MKRNLLQRLVFLKEVPFQRLLPHSSAWKECFYSTVSPVAAPEGFLSQHLLPGIPFTCILVYLSQCTWAPWMRCYVLINVSYLIQHLAHLRDLTNVYWINNEWMISNPAPLPGLPPLPSTEAAGSSQGHLPPPGSELHPTIAPFQQQGHPSKTQCPTCCQDGPSPTSSLLIFMTLWDKHCCPWIYRQGAEAQSGCMRSSISEQNSDSTPGLFAQIPTAASQVSPG